MRALVPGLAACALAACSLAACSTAGDASTPPARTIAVAPGQSIQHALDRLDPHAGGTLVLAGGTYRRQRIVLAHRDHITVRAAVGARPILDETGLVPPDGDSGVIEIEGGHALTISGLTITGYRTSSLAKVPVGIYVTGAASDVHIAHNHVHHLGNDNGTRGSFDINAHGIAVYGTDPHHAVTGLLITHNEVDHLVLGASEAVVVNGNVDGWTIADNEVHDDNNIAIDAIGYEPTIGGAARYRDVNRARHGLIAGNQIARIASSGNPSYWSNGSWCNCADGIYVDGGRAITVRHNTVRRADIGVEIAAENPRGGTDNVSVSDNDIGASAYTGLSIGGYGPNRGDAADVRVTGNTLRGNNTLNDGSPEILLQYKVHQTTITGNHVTATHAGDPALVERVPAAGTAAQNAGVVLDRNDYGAPVPATQAVFTWLGKQLTGIAAYRAASGQDASSTFSRR